MSADKTVGWGPPVRNRPRTNSSDVPIPPSAVKAEPGKQQPAAKPAPSRPITVADDLVVGWLVIVAGPGRGADYRLRPGMNSIGRGGGATIDLTHGDMDIAEGTHCRVTFDPRSARFFLSPGDGPHLTRLPDEPVPVLMTTPLDAMQDIEIGETRLRFVPFCTPDFQWND